MQKKTNNKIQTRKKYTYIIIILAHVELLVENSIIRK